MDREESLMSLDERINYVNESRKAEEEKPLRQILTDDL